MDTTIARYERLGFAFTPLSIPRIRLAPEPIGAGNRTAIFAENYLEVLGHNPSGIAGRPSSAARTTG